MVEERVKTHPKFRKLAVGGTPDVRVIVYNKVPVMAMLRIPTEESGGKANLHQGAIGLWIDMATGITTHGVYKDEPIRYFPDTDKKVNGIAIPFWSEILKLAIQAQTTSKLNFFCSKIFSFVSSPSSFANFSSILVESAPVSTFAGTIALFFFPVFIFIVSKTPTTFFSTLASRTRLAN